MGASQRLNGAGADEARAILRTCCGSTRWVEGMLARRPFADDDALLASAEAVWFGLSEADWREAFSHHPRIGDRESLAQRFPDTHALSAREQAGVGGASRDVLEALAARNQEYEERFGYIFIVCATGRSAADMLAMIERRLHHPAGVEIRIAAGEQARITALRLRAVG